MKRFWNKYKKVIIGGFITIVVLQLIYLAAANWLFPSNNAKEPIAQKNELKQDNKGANNVTNEFVAGNKIINEKDTQPVIINKGNLSTNQKGGTVVQNYYEKTPPLAGRSLTKADNKRLENEIPKNSPVEVLYTIGEKESENYMNKVVNKLKSLKIEHKIQGVGMLIVSADDTSSRFKIVPEPTGTKLYIMKQSQ